MGGSGTETDLKSLQSCNILYFSGTVSGLNQIRVVYRRDETTTIKQGQTKESTSAHDITLHKTGYYYSIHLGVYLIYTEPP